MPGRRYRCSAWPLIGVGRQCLPVLHRRVARLAQFADTANESCALHEAYTAMGSADFSKADLDPCPPSLAVSTLPALTWCDWGTPERVLKSLRRQGVSPSWAAAVESLRVSTVPDGTGAAVYGLARADARPQPFGDRA